MNNLTTTDLSRIFGERIGQEYLVCYNIENNPVIEPITPKVIEDIKPDSHNKRDLLLLTPLEKISDEDAEEVGYDNAESFLRNAYSSLDKLPLMRYKDYKYLINTGYDIEGLIEKGVAIEKPIYGESPFKEAVKALAKLSEIDRIRNSRK